MVDNLRSPDGESPVVLVVPPVLYPGQPSLGAFVLAPAVTRTGVRAQVVEANVAFAGRVGFDVVKALAGSLPWKLLGEALFWGAAFPERASEHARILSVLNQQEGPGRVSMKFLPLSESDLLGYAAEVPGFISDMVERLLGMSPRIVGFSSMGQQTLASVAMAREIKRRNPDVITVLGGSNPTEPAASGILAATDAFDYIFSGEADIMFPEFCRAYVQEGKLPQSRVVTCAPIKDLNIVPLPEYEAYFSELKPYRATNPEVAKWPFTLLFESSRGCWWGDKHLCTFCGYITPGTRYRTRSPEKVLEDVHAIAEKYGVKRLRTSDAIMPADFTRTVLPMLIEQGVETSLAYEIKANQKEADLDTFVRAGMDEVQPGIESLSSHVLTLMSKGITALENVRLLRDSRSRGLVIVWNFITAFPGETQEDYEAMIRLIPLIEHLQAPVRWGAIHISRYSPYHTDPAKYGIKNLRPFPVYDELWGKSAALVAHNFDAEYQSAWDYPDLVARFNQTVERWNQPWSEARQPFLEVRTVGNEKIVRDERKVAKVATYRLSQEELEVLEMVRSDVQDSAIAPSHRAALDKLVELGFVVFYEDRYMSLLTEPEIGERLNAERQETLARKRRGEAASVAA